MARKKITLAYLTKESERKASFKKRNKGLMKKVEELSTLCGVDACAITYSEFQPHPEVWPSPPEARRILERFNAHPDMDRSRFADNQMSFTRQRIEKAGNKLRRLQRENKRKELTIFMFQCIEGTANIRDLDARDTGEMNVVIDDVLREITERMERLKAGDEGPSNARADDGEGSSAMELRPDEVAALDRIFGEDPQSFSFMNLLLSPDHRDADFGWNHTTLSFPPDVPDSIRDAQSAPESD